MVLNGDYTEGVMRKNVKTALFLSVILCLTMISSGCGNTNNNKKPPQTETKILAPYVISFGNYLSWDEAKNADEYDVYKNGVYLETTAKTFYFTQETSGDDEYYIVAKNKDMQSEKSNIAFVSKNKNFASDEILDLTDKSNFHGTIAPEIRRVIIGNDTDSVFGILAEIEDRTSDLTFLLNNVTVNGSIFTKNRSYSRKDNNYSVIFDVTGECAIRGENGLDGSDWSDARFDNLEFIAGEGENGQDAVIVPSAVVVGSGNLSVCGGNGGNGGVGSSTTEYETVSGPGPGANGGNGGSAVKTSHLFLNMNGGEYSVSISDGKGGLKGKPGKNGSIYTGPLATIMWSDVYDIGKAGVDGKSIVVSRKVLKGKLVF